MDVLAKILIIIVALEHFYILYIEMFAWETTGKKVFKGALPDEMFSKTKGLAANQGLYNGFLGAGLLWSLYTGDVKVTIFFLSCVIIASLYGAYKSSRSILLKQGLPAILALISVILFL
ncbi:DUF1304 domain-containing protein [Candidatus Gracilibacteria bacterium]|nr:MAG: DUF1304 domain-containing protein [Candidatus Gracilibacteria bacterium]